MLEVFIVQVVSQPPGGVFSTCCNSTREVCNHSPVDPHFAPKICADYATFTGISCAVRRHFMQLTVDKNNAFWQTNCPFNPFYSIIVNHTGPNIEDGIVLCEGASDPFALGALYHAETRTLRNCYEFIIDRFGSAQVNSPLIWQQLSLYSTAASCAMCASTERWTKIGEVVSGPSDAMMNEFQWNQIGVFDDQIQQSSNECVFGDPTVPTSYQTRLIKDVLNDVLIPYFSWQFFPANPCPSGCHRDLVSGGCTDND